MKKNNEELLKSKAEIKAEAKEHAIEVKIAKEELEEFVAKQNVEIKKLRKQIDDKRKEVYVLNKKALKLMKAAGKDESKYVEANAAKAAVIAANKKFAEEKAVIKKALNKLNQEVVDERDKFKSFELNIGNDGENPFDLPKDVVARYDNVEVQFSVRGKILTAIRGISLDIRRGEVISIVGESGSGKSVLTKCLTGMLEANGTISKGHIYYDKYDVTEFKTHKDWLQVRGKKIATIFQDPMTSLNPLRTIGSQLREVLTLHRGMTKTEATEEAIRLLERIGIPSPELRINDKPFQYSGGMRQRVVIAIALACNPEILICDEPTTALDVTIQAQILDLLKELAREYGFTVVFITHDLGVVANVADRVAVMYFGQIVEFGTSQDIFYHARHPYTWALLSSLPQLGEKGENLYSISGTPPSLFHKVTGDAFANRNPYALEIDYYEEPPFFKITETHYAKTWLLDNRAPKVKRPKIIDEIPERVRKIYAGGGQ